MQLTGTNAKSENREPTNELLNFIQSLIDTKAVPVIPNLTNIGSV